MSSRVGGAALALLAALLLVVSLATSAWWTGPIRLKGRVIEGKTISIGLLGGEGCNTGGDGKCFDLAKGREPIIAGGFKVLGLATFAAAGLLTLAVLGLGVAAWLGSPQRRQLPWLVLGVGAAALIVSLLFILQRPEKADVPIGYGLFAFWLGLVVAGLRAGLGLRPEVVRPIAPAVPAMYGGTPVDMLALLGGPEQGRPLPPAGTPLGFTPGAMTGLPAPVAQQTHLPTGIGSPRLGAAAAPPPYEPDSSLGGTQGLFAGAVAPPFEGMPVVAPFSTMPPPPPDSVIPPPRPAIAPPPRPRTATATAPPPRPAPPRPATLPPPMTPAPIIAAPPTAIPLPPLFGGGRPPVTPPRGKPASVAPPSSALPSSIPAAVRAAMPTPARATAAPTLVKPPPETAAQRAATEATSASEPLDPPDATDARPRVEPERTETGITPIGDENTSPAFAIDPDHDLAEAPGPAAGALHHDSIDEDAETSAREKMSPEELGLVSRPKVTGALAHAATQPIDISDLAPPRREGSGVTPGMMAMHDDTSDLTAGPIEPPRPSGVITSATPVPPAAVPAASALSISTAPDSLAPPSDEQLATSGPSPACPQCEAPMVWVEEHLRFYCKSCRMYF